MTEGALQFSTARRREAPDSLGQRRAWNGPKVIAIGHATSLQALISTQRHLLCDMPYRGSDFDCQELV